MPLYKLEEFDPNYRETFGGDDVKSLELFTESGELIGKIADVLVDKDGKFRYLVVATNSDTVNKQILLPIGLSHINYPAKRVYVDGLSRQQVEHLPEYYEHSIVDEAYEDNIRNVFLPLIGDTRYEQVKYSHQQEPSLYNFTDQYHQTFRLYEERLIANKQRVKTGEVAVSKHIETETSRVSIPVKKERVVIERVPPTGTDTIVDPKEVKFQSGEVARIDIYEETPEIRKQAFVREEVRVKKVIEQDTVEAQDIIRREELDIDTAGNTNLQQP